jgi:hypothetical protein
MSNFIHKTISDFTLLTKTEIHEILETEANRRLKGKISLEEELMILRLEKIDSDLYNILCDFIDCYIPPEPEDESPTEQEKK